MSSHAKLEGSVVVADDHCSLLWVPEIRESMAGTDHITVAFELHIAGLEDNFGIGVLDCILQDSTRLCYGGCRWGSLARSQFVDGADYSKVHGSDVEE